MNIGKTAITGFALFAAIITCQASRLAPTNSYYSDDVAEPSAKGADDVDKEGGDAADVESLDLNALEKGDTIFFSLEDDFPEAIDGHEVLASFLPDGVALEWTGKKLKAPKAGKIKYSREDEDFVDIKESENPSGLSAKLNKKKRTISGSFKVFVIKGGTKLKTYKAKFSGKVGESLKVTVKKRVVAVATIE